MIEKIKQHLGRAADHVKEHKLLYGVGAAGAGLGYLFVSSRMSAPALPPVPQVAKPIVQNGVTTGIAIPSNNGPVVVPAPASVHTGEALWVATQTDPLSARSGPGTNYAKVGSWPKNGPVTVLSNPQDGFVRVQGPGTDAKGNPLIVLEGWASLQYLSDKMPAGIPADNLLSALHDLGIM